MLRLKDLENRRYIGKECHEFMYRIVNEKKEEYATAMFRRGSQENEWIMKLTFERTRDSDSQHYHFGYIMPRAGIPLETIAATGLKYFQLFLTNEVQTKVDMGMVLSSVLEGM